MPVRMPVKLLLKELLCDFTFACVHVASALAMVFLLIRCYKSQR